LSERLGSVSFWYTVVVVVLRGDPEGETWMSLFLLGLVDCVVVSRDCVSIGSLKGLSGSWIGPCVICEDPGTPICVGVLGLAVSYKPVGP